MFEILSSFLVGLTGSLHCVGMCGPLIIALSLQSGKTYRKSADRRFFTGTASCHLAFHAGRIITYALLGGVVAGVFSSLDVHRFSMQYRAAIAAVSGLAIIGLGLVILGVFPLPGFVARLLSPQASVFGRKLAGLLNSEKPGSKIGLGLLAGLLPCGLTWAMLVAAAATLSPVKGLAMMFSFGIGTVPILLAAGIPASFASARVRLLGERAAAIFICIMGASMAVRGLGVMLGFGDHCGPMDLLTKAGLL